MSLKESINSLDKKEKFFLIVPLLVLPFICFAFWSLGGGSGEPVPAGKQADKPGLNTALPKANLKEDKLTKLQFYEQAAKDSAHMRELMRLDPYFKNSLAGTAAVHKDSVQLSLRSYSSSGNTNAGGLYQPKDPNEEKVYAKIAQLNAQLEQSRSSPTSTRPMTTTIASPPAAGRSAEIDRLETMMNSLKDNSGNDEEMTQINTMLDKLIDIQHPERAKEKIQQASATHQNVVYPVSTATNDVPVSLLQKKATPLPDTALRLPARRSVPHNHFFSLEDGLAEGADMVGSIRAVVDETQTVVTGAIIGLRLLDDIYIKGVLVPKGTLLNGVASLSGERLEVTINSLRYQNFLLPVSLSVYDMDGLPGFFVPGAITRDVAKQSTDQALQSMTLTSLDPSVGAQATAAGIQAAKSLIGKKVKLVKVTIKSGYKVLLKDNNNK